ncbi:MAG: OB-fold domain-containing protein [Pseudomonadales bacterium]|nr:OB-fold domain-containing protein [Pseudomonadales bacterium]
MNEQTQRWFPNSMPAPMVDKYSLPWWQACAENRMTAQRCKSCNHAQLPPAPLCSECRGNDFELTALSGKGRLYTYTAVHQPVSMEQTLPFIIAVIELDVEGTPCKNPVRLMSNLVECEEADLEIGKPVHVVWEKMSDMVSIPRFKFTV